MQSSSYAGWWLMFVSMPLIQFLTLRWYYRFFIWARFLWQVSRTRLNLEATHPDGTGGLLFLARSGRAFRVVLLALGTMLSGMIANRIFHADAMLLHSRWKSSYGGRAGVPCTRTAVRFLLAIAGDPAHGND